MGGAMGGAVRALWLVLGLGLGGGAHGYVCMHYQKLEPGARYVIMSPGWPSTYHAGDSCQWVAEAPADMRVAFECDDFFMPGPSTNESLTCSDVLLLSTTGAHINLDGMPYVGHDTVVTSGNLLNVELRSSFRHNVEGRFRCYAQATKDSQSNFRGRIAEPAPEKQAHSPDMCSCGWRVDGNSGAGPNLFGGRIANGVDVRPNEYPMMAALLQGDQVVCGAVLVAARYALTSAHCIPPDGSLDSIELAVGEFNTTIEVEGVVQQRLKLAAFERHPSWSGSWNRANIAVVKTKEDVKMSLYTGPACVPANKSADQFLAPSETLIILGWGSAEYQKETSNRLKLMTAPLINPNECASRYGQLSDEHFCTGAQDHQSVCTGDPGGPLLWMSPRTKRLMVAGIVAYGDGCNGNSVINTKVSSYIDWIKEVTQNTICHSR